MTRWFPIMDGPAIPWSMIEPHEAQAKENHDQSLEQLARRGGLCPMEACLVLEGRDLSSAQRFAESDDQWLARLRQHVRVDLTAELEQLRVEVKSLERFRDLRTRHNDEMERKQVRIARLESQLRNIFSVAIHGGDSEGSRLSSIRNLCREMGVIREEP